jgi:hypothetical protein
MKIGGKWVGFGLGDNDPEVRRLKEFMRRKFSYAEHLADNESFDQPMLVAVMTMQTNYHIPVTGIVDFATKTRMGFVKLAPPARPTLLTVNGTGVSMWDGPPADVARGVEEKYYWQPIGYPGTAFPMDPSVAQGRAELCYQISKHPGEFAMIGYSQGAIVTSQVYKYDLLAPNGVLHHRLRDLKKAVTFGNPMREQGHTFPGDFDAPDGRGIADDRLVNTPDWWWDFAHRGDIYTDNPDDDSGEDKTAIYKIVMSQWWGGPDSILMQILEVVQRPIPEIFAMLQAMTSAGLFFASGTGPHVNYDPRPAIDYLRAESLVLQP